MYSICSANMFVNYKDFHTKSVQNAPDLEHIINDIYVNTQTCFGSIDDDSSNAEMSDSYKRRIIRYLHRNIEPVSSRSSRQGAKRQKRRNEICGIKCRSRTSDTTANRRDRWELFTILTHDASRKKWDVHASCLVEFDDIFQSCEIHEVCVATTGRKLCQQLIQKVCDHIKTGASGPIREIRIFCDNTNAAACACYTKSMLGATIIRTHSTTAFVLTFPIKLLLDLE